MFIIPGHVFSVNEGELVMNHEIQCKTCSHQPDEDTLLNRQSIGDLVRDILESTIRDGDNSDKEMKI